MCGCVYARTFRTSMRNVRRRETEFSWHNAKASSKQQKFVQCNICIQSPRELGPQIWSLRCLPKKRGPVFWEQQTFWFGFIFRAALHIVHPDLDVTR